VQVLAFLSSLNLTSEPTDPRQPGFSEAHGPPTHTLAVRLPRIRLPPVSSVVMVPA